MEDHGDASLQPESGEASQQKPWIFPAGGW